MVTNFQEAKIQNREALRRGLLDVTSRLLAEKGPEALNMREVAKEVNASTKVLYTLFGSKEGLLDALYQEGFGRLKAAFDSIEAGPPLERVGAIGRTFRAFALENPYYYAILIHKHQGGFNQSAQNQQLALDSFDVLQQCIRECIDTGIMTGDAELIAATISSCLHGEISLELAGSFYKYPQEWREQLFELMLQNITRSFFSREYLLKTLGVRDPD